MFKNLVLHYVAIVLSIIILVKISLPNLRKSWEKKMRARKIWKYAFETIVESIKYYASRYGGESPVFRKFGIEWTDPYAGKKLGDFLMRNKEKLYKLQGFFDQVLKMYAEELQRAHAAEEKAKRQFDGKVERSGTFPRETIDWILSNGDKAVMEKDLAEKRFWDLHDTLTLIGLQTWGHWSYKVYLYLEPQDISETLKS